MSSESWKPRLRPDVVALELEEGWFLTDDARGLVVVLDEVRFRAARLFDGTRSVARVRHDLEQAGGRIAGPTLDKLTRQLLFMHLFEGTGDETRMAHIMARAKGLRSHVPNLPISGLSETRFACQMCGSCCRTSLRGPVTAEEVRRISSYDWIGRYPQLKERERLFESADINGKATHMLATHQGRCVFLSDDDRCIIHLESGGNAKPAACQLFPFLALPTVDDVTIFDSGECATFGTSSRRGPKLEEADEVRQQAFRKMAMESELFHPTVQLPAGVDIDFSHYLPLESYLVGFVELELADFASTLVGVRNIIYSYQDVLLKYPLGADLPERLRQEIPTLDPEPFVPDAEDPDPDNRPAFERALDVLLKSVLKELHRAVSFSLEHEVAHLSFPTPVYRELIGLIEAFRAMIAPPESDAWSLLDEEEARRVRLATKVGVPGLGAFDDYFRRSLRQRLHGKTLVRVDSRIDAGFVHLMLVHLLTLAGARLKAADGGRATVGLADLDRSQSMVLRGLKPHLFPGMLTRERGALLECFLRVSPGLLR